MFIFLFCCMNQLVAIAQAAEKNKILVPGVVNGNFVAAKKMEQAQKHAEVKEKQPLKGRKLRERSKINVRTFSSVLSARSKAAGRNMPSKFRHHYEVIQERTAAEGIERKIVVEYNGFNVMFNYYMSSYWYGISTLTHPL
ncbi:uncharacterized protein LOC131599578 [Vicia villosa]|uniref:uncharacterized protein LOC131599578 n=1 Tax=Vicia villosa TaxID=3911 RepID=UPI00273CC16C|nr:uncharacterized protein LOC131599578 [Vicia villosa]